MDLHFDENQFVHTLSGLIGEAKHLQNNPPAHVPSESRAIAIVRKVLDPLSTEHGGPLKITQVEYKPGRGNLIVEYPGSTDKVVSFVGSHLDVVTADPSTWDRDPFKLTRDVSCARANFFVPKDKHGLHRSNFVRVLWSDV